jgi:hypothetical protein
VGQFYRIGASDGGLKEVYMNIGYQVKGEVQRKVGRGCFFNDENKKELPGKARCRTGNLEWKEKKLGART